MSNFRNSFNNWISASGAMLAISSFFAFILLFAFDLFGGFNNPYSGILTFIVAPAFLILGLGLILVGWLWDKIQIRRGKKISSALRFTFDFSQTKERKKFFIFAGLSLGFLLLTAVGSYRTYHMTESVQFCGEVCHVMEPQFSTFKNAPHSHIACIDCHIGEGMENLVKAKMQGLHQVYQMVTSSYPKPIKKVPVELRPTSETCLACHWPGTPYGNQDRTFTHFLSDDENTPFSVRMIMKVGGGDPRLGPVKGIHWHTDPANKVEYYSPDPYLEEIPWIRRTLADGSEKVYTREGFDGEIEPNEVFTMNCLDCHNRPAHAFIPPNDLVDQLLLLGRLDPKWESIKYNAVELLVEEYTTREEAHVAIEAGLKENYDGEANVDSAIKHLQRAYDENFFPYMNANWDLYPSQIGHKDSMGCFRCHGGEHFEELTGDPMPESDCNSCHEIIAQDNTDKLITISHEAPLTFEHPDGDIDGLLCTDCHTGGLQ